MLKNESNRIITLEQEFSYQVADSQCHLWMVENKLAGYSWYVPKGKNYLNVGIGGTLNGIKSENSSIKFHWNMLIDKLKKIGLVQNFEFTPKGYKARMANISISSWLDSTFTIAPL